MRSLFRLTPKSAVPMAKCLCEYGMQSCMKMLRAGQIIAIFYITRIKPVNAADTGVYYCCATNNRGSRTSCSQFDPLPGTKYPMSLPVIMC